MAASADGGTDPIHQFEVYPLLEIPLFGMDLSFTNASLFMVLAVIAASALLVLGFGRGTLIPGRIQSIAEIFYEFIAKMVRDNVGKDGMHFFPFVLTLFMFVFACNMLGMIPGGFTVTSQIIVCAALALLVIGTVILYGFYKHGLGFLKLFVPDVPPALLPILVPIEIISFISRPLSLSVRLFANMLAGHITLKVFAGFVASMAVAGPLGVVGASLPLLMTIALTALEFLVAGLQAFIFAVLTCIYLHDAMHPHH